jgi:hypothetical protein
MNFKRDFLPQFNNLPYFTKESLVISSAKFDIPRPSLDVYISRAMKSRELIRLKRNHYVTAEFYEKNKSDQSYIYYISNILLAPSYISLESALQYYGMLTEGINNFTTAVSSKLPREFKNNLGVFSYRKISNSLFDDFIYKKGNFEYLMAKPEKALFDYLYYKTNRFINDFSEDILEEFRIETDILKINEKKRLGKMISKFTSKKIKT